eukprot:351986-Chlamydomonas_euryale.AAC.3
MPYAGTIVLYCCSKLPRLGFERPSCHSLPSSTGLVGNAPPFAVSVKIKCQAGVMSAQDGIAMQRMKACLAAFRV